MNQLIWIGRTKREFTVQSAYHMEKNHFVYVAGESTTIVAQSRVWKAIWNLNVLGMVIIFLCMACSNILPTKENLFKKKIAQDPLCPICGLKVQNKCHILWCYSSSNDI
jgi:hypothetical protein